MFAGSVMDNLFIAESAHKESFSSFEITFTSLQFTAPVSSVLYAIDSLLLQETNIEATTDMIKK